MKRFDVSRGVKILTDTCLNIKPDENVLIVTDTNMTEISEIIAIVASERGSEVTLTMMNPLPAPGMEPPKPVAAAMKSAEVIMMVTTFSLTPSIARAQAQKAGARILSLGGYNYDILLSEALRADFMVQKTIVEEVAKRLTKAECVQIFSAAGTNLKLRLGNRKAHALSNICHDPGTLGSPPDIEAYIAPMENTAEGILFIDGAICLPEFGLVDEPIQLDIKEGRVVNIDGKDNANRFKEKLDSFDDPEMYCIAELGIGLNPKAELVGDPLIDEGVLGSAHIALGLNFTYGGTIKDAKTHIDCVFRNPNILLDDKKLLIDGELVKENEGG